MLSLNFDTLGVGTCNGDEVNTVRALAAGGSANASGSQVIYATTDGLGPNDLSTPIGGNVWVTTNATAVSGVISTFTNVTLNGPGGSSINPNQVPISSVAIDTSDATGNTAYVTVMGFTGGPGHVWQTTNAGNTWTDWTDFGGTEPLPDSPANAVVVDPSAHMVYVGTDVGVFQSSTFAPAWTELGPTSSSQQNGFLPNVAVTALAIFNSGGQKLLRASTYGRGVWQFNLVSTPDFQIAVSNTPLTVFPGTTATFNGTVSALNGYNNSVALSCTAGSSPPPTPCAPMPVSVTATSVGAAFLVTPGTGTIGDYNFNVQGIGSDPNNTTHVAAVTLSVVNFGLTKPSPATLNEPPGAASPPISFQATAQGSFNQSVSLSCGFSPSISGANCVFTPGAVVNPTSVSPVNMTATVIVPVGTACRKLHGHAASHNCRGARSHDHFVHDGCNPKRGLYRKFLYRGPGRGGRTNDQPLQSGDCAHGICVRRSRNSFLQRNSIRGAVQLHSEFGHPRKQLRECGADDRHHGCNHRRHLHRHGYGNIRLALALGHNVRPHGEQFSTRSQPALRRRRGRRVSASSESIFDA